MNTISSAFETIQKKIDKACEPVGNYLDKNPTVYKIVLIASHLFRMTAMVGMMKYLPTPPPITAAIMIGGSLLYSAAIERFCCFRFAIPSLVGAGAAQLAYPAFVNVVSGKALESLSAAFGNGLRLSPFSCYLIWIIKISHRDIEKHLSAQRACPRNS